MGEPAEKPAPVRRPRAGLVGPLFKYELVRLARRGQDARARFILAIALLFVLTTFTLIWFRHSDPMDVIFGGTQSLTLEQSSRFANNFTFTFILAQLAVLVLLAPAYAAGGISEDKEKKTFIFLLVSDLTGWEIVIGKFLGRLVFLLGVMLAGLPILSFTLLFGGVSVYFLMMAYFLTATTITFLTAVGAAAASATETLRGAMFRAYGITALHVTVGCGIHPILSPFGIITLLFQIEGDSLATFLVIGGLYGGTQLLVAVLSVLLAVYWVRKSRATASAKPAPRQRRRERDTDRPKYVPKKLEIVVDDHPEVLGEAEVLATEAGDVLPFAEPLPTARRSLPPPPPRPDPVRRRRNPPPEPDYIRNRPRVYGADPFYWKEKFTTGTKYTADDDSIRGVLLAVGVAVGIMVAFFLMIAILTVLLSGGNRGGLDAAESLLLLCGLGGTFTYLLVVGSGAAGAVVRERQRLTLESLLTIPVPRQDILWPKWKVNFRKGWWWGFITLGCIPFAVLISEVPLLAFPVGFYSFAIVPLTVSYALWLSIRCTTASRAVLWLLPGVGLTLLFPMAIWMATPPELEWVGMAVIAAAAIGLALGAWGFWLLAVRAFEREGR